MEQADRKSRLFEINSKAAAYFYYKLRSEAGKYGYAYLTGRGLTEETIKKFGLGYSDKFSDDLYRYLKSKGYADELLNESGLFMLMGRILQDAGKRLDSFSEFIFEPQSELKAFRRILAERNLRIEDEQLILEDGKYYTVMTCNKHP